VHHGTALQYLLLLKVRLQTAHRHHLDAAAAASPPNSPTPPNTDFSATQLLVMLKVTFQIQFLLAANLMMLKLLALLQTSHLLLILFPQLLGMSLILRESLASVLLLMQVNYIRMCAGCGPWCANCNTVS